MSGAAVGDFRDRAFDLLRVSSAQQAFDIEREPASVCAAYGPHLFGQGCLLARRLLEAGVALVTVYWHYEGPKDSPVWDTHANNFPHMRNRLAPPADRGIACLLRELSQRGLLEDTLFVCLGEFGRSPRINREAGRDHWPQAQSILMAGAGIQGGTVFGATDRTGAAPAQQAVSPSDFTATVLCLLGLRPDLELRDHGGRPHRASEGTPIAELVS